MALPASKVNTYERRISRLKKHIEILKEAAVDRIAEQARVRLHYQNVVAQHLATERKQTQKILEDTFKIQELDNQMAVLWRDRAEARTDLEACKLVNVARTKECQQLRDGRKQLTMDRANQDISVQSLLARVKYLERSFGHRLWVAIAAQRAHIRQGIASLRERAVARFMVRRLNKHRVAALNEAGHIPEKLVKVAIKYWEHDKQRMAMDEQIRSIHTGTRNGKEYADVVVDKRPSAWRRLMILIGRA